MADDGDDRVYNIVGAVKSAAGVASDGDPTRCRPGSAPTRCAPCPTHAARPAAAPGAWASAS